MSWSAGPVRGSTTTGGRPFLFSSESQLPGRMLIVMFRKGLLALVLQDRCQPTYNCLSRWREAEKVSCPAHQALAGVGVAVI